MYRKMPAAACKLAFGRVVRAIYHVSNQEEIPTMVDYMMQVWRMPGTFEYSIYQITAQGIKCRLGLASEDRLGG